jgi:hypothetical protein
VEPVLEVIEVTDKTITEAIEVFQHDSQAKQQGIAAEVQGQGPGLKVILKDVTGSIIRKFTGEEFLRMRKSVQDGRISGKILDQKV